MTLRIFRRNSDGSGFALDTGVLSGLTAAQLTSMQNAGYTVTNIAGTDLRNVVTVHGFNPNQMPGGGEQITLPQRIPLTVQGASEDFITSQMQQVLISFGQQTNTINGNVVIMRDQVKAHVTTEADRIIASA